MIRKIKSFFKNPLFSGSIILMIGSMVANVINYVYHLLMGRMLGPSDYGVLASLFSIFYIIGIVPLSSSVAITKFISSAKNKRELTETYQGIKKFILKLALVLSLLLAIFTPFLASFLHINQIFSVFLLTPILFFNLLTLVNLATSQGRIKFLGFVIPSIISSGGKLLFGIILVALGFSVFGAMVGIVISMILTFLVSLKYVKDISAKKRKSDFKIKPFLKYALPVLLQSLAFTSFFTMDLILVKHFMSAYEAGLYAALSTLGKIIYFAVSPISSAMFPIISKRKALGEKYANVFLISLIATLVVSLAIVAVYYFFPNIAIGVLYGKDYLVVSKELFWMGMFMFFYTASFVIVNYLLSIGITQVVVIPLVASLIQIVGIYKTHRNILEVIRISLFVMLGMFMVLISYLMYNRLVEDEKR
ncbi:oligosaccharide flippase family protein [Patescibacteria group bacterium]